MAVSRDDRVPLYLQIYDVLKDEIEGETYVPGDKIPTEHELSQRFNVSRITVKQAIQKLVQEGLLYRIQGKGTFVNKSKVQRQLVGLISFQEEMVQRGYTPKTKVLELEAVGASRTAAKALQILPGSPVVMVRRLRLADDEVMGIQTAYLPLELVPGLLEQREALSGSLYALLGEMGKRPVRGRETYRAVAADELSASLIGVEPGAPALAVQRVSYLADGSPIEYVDSVLRADRYTLDVELSSL